jgi:hypothetical protein
MATPPSPPEQAIAALTLTFSLVLPPFVFYLSTLRAACSILPRSKRAILRLLRVFWVLLAWSITLIRAQDATGMADWSSGVGGLGSAFCRSLFEPLPARRTPNDTQTILSQAEPGDAVLLDSWEGATRSFCTTMSENAASLSPPMVTISRAEDQVVADQVDEKLRDFSKTISVSG